MVKKKAPVAKVSSTRNKASILLGVFDGKRQPMPDGTELLIRISDGSQRQLENGFFEKSSLRFEVPFSDNFKDKFTVLVTCKGYRDVGFFPVKVSPDAPALVDLMLAPKEAKYKFPS